MRQFEGMTLIEVLISVAICSIIIGGMILAFVTGDKTFRSEVDLVTLQQQSRFAMDGMSRELRQIEIIPSEGKNITIITTAYGSEITFYIIDNDDSIRYYLSNNQILRSHASVTRVLANNIDTLSFCCRSGSSCDSTCSSPEAVQVQLRAKKTVRGREITFPTSKDANLIERVKLRNE